MCRSKKRDSTKSPKMMEGDKKTGNGVGHLSPKEKDPEYAKN